MGSGGKLRRPSAEGSRAWADQPSIDYSSQKPTRALMYVHVSFALICVRVYHSRSQASTTRRRTWRSARSTASATCRMWWMVGLRRGGFGQRHSGTSQACGRNRRACAARAFCRAAQGSACTRSAVPRVVAPLRRQAPSRSSPATLLPSAPTTCASSPTRTSTPRATAGGAGCGVV
jgi:hypothetical protein